MSKNVHGLECQNVTFYLLLQNCSIDPISKCQIFSVYNVHFIKRFTEINWDSFCIKTQNHSLHYTIKSTVNKYNQFPNHTGQMDRQYQSKVKKYKHLITFKNPLHNGPFPNKATANLWIHFLPSPMQPVKNFHSRQPQFNMIKP